ncbi:TRIM2 [Branchiostoma lanceolatum]|uniref:TRIM2 protein n=1 Tax=Branchiostoma lanceolatum TaxID=7740 RepID=A0A8K0EPX3_BRALA|nr:TRIM2 [Branchiostoma lanceolatum]
MAEKLPSDVTSRRLKGDPLQTNMKQASVSTDCTLWPGDRHGDRSIPNTSSCHENTDGDHYPNLSAANEVTAEDGSDGSGNYAGMSDSVGDDSNMHDIRHSSGALSRNPKCDRDTLNPDLMYSQNDTSPNPTYAPNATGTDIEYPQNAGNQEKMNELCSEATHRPTKSDGTSSIEPLTATHHDGDNNELTTSDAEADNKEIDYMTRDATVEVNTVPSVCPKSTSRPANNDLYIKPYAVRYQTHDENHRGGTPYAVRHLEDDEDEISHEIDGAYGNRRSYHTASGDVEITPYAVAYMCQYDMTDVTRRDTPMNDADTSASAPNDSDVRRIRHHHWRTLHHQDPSSIPNVLIPNAMHMPNVPQQAARDRNYKQHTRCHTLTSLLQLRGFYSKHGPSADADPKCYECDFYHNGFCQKDFYINVKDVLPPDDDAIQPDPICEDQRCCYSIHLYSYGGIVTQMSTFGGKGRNPGQVDYPRGVAVSADNEIYVADFGNKRIQVFDKYGDFLHLFKTEAAGICTDSSGHIFVSNMKNRRIDMFTSRGEFVRTVFRMKNPWGLACGPDGQLVVVTAWLNTITIIPR